MKNSANHKLNTLRRLFSYFNKKRMALYILCIILAIICSLSYLFGTYLLKDVVDKAIAKNDMHLLINYVLLIAGIYLLGATSNLIYLQIMAKVAQGVIFDVRNDLVKHLMHLPLSYIDKQGHGKLMSYFTNDIDTLYNALNVSFINIVYTSCNAVGTIIFLLFLNIYLSLIVVFFILIMSIFLIYNLKRCRKYYSLNQKQLANINNNIEEKVHGIKEEKIFMHQKENLEDFKKANDELRVTSTKAFYYTQISVPVIVSLSYFNFAISAVVGSIFAINNIITYGILSSYLVYVRQSAQPFNYFISHTNVILNALAGAERIFDFMDIPEEENDGSIKFVNYKVDNNKLVEVEDINLPKAWKLNDGTLVPIKGDVRFNNVVFSYNKDKIVLNNISLFADPNQKIAFVGSTGAGKTTIISLLNRLYDIDSGEILLDGINIKDINKNYLRKSIGVVNQDTHLFKGTILDNLKFIKPDATQDEIDNALRLANADKFINNLKDNLNSMISNSSSNISSGEKQLLSIARAILSNAPILVLDEATSNVDTKTEKLIENGMDNLIKDHTVLIIAHRLSTIVNSDAILFLENGKIIERGNHEDLLLQKGEYYKLFTGKSTLK